MDQEVMDAVLHVRTVVRRAMDALRVGFVLREQQRRSAVAPEESVAQFGVTRLDRIADSHQTRLVRLAAPRPSVAEPQGRYDVYFRARGTPIVDRDLDQKVLGSGLRVLHEHIEV